MFRRKQLSEQEILNEIKKIDVKLEDNENKVALWDRRLRPFFIVGVVGFLIGWLTKWYFLFALAVLCLPYLLYYFGYQNGRIALHNHLVLKRKRLVKKLS